HAAHVDEAKRTLAALHRDTVFRHGHAHPGHLAHTGVAHRHVRGQEAADLLVEVPRLYPDHVGNVVAHLVHNVVGHVAVQRPVPWLVGHELEGPRAADLHQDGRLYLLGRRRDLPTVSLRDFELIPMEMDGVVVRGAQVDQTDFHAVTEPGHQRGG